MPDFTPDINDAGVRKWRKRRIGISDYGDSAITVPASGPALFHTDGLPIVWPAGVKDLGYITTDGTTSGVDISSNPTQMLQSLRPVRDDLESVVDSLTAAFGEANAWVKAMRKFLPVAQWPADRDQAWSFAGEEITDLPYYTIWMLSQDGVGTQAVYRHEVIRKAKITAMTESVMNASDAETSGFTFGIYVDDVTGQTNIEAQDGPAYTTHVGTVAVV